MSNQVLKKQSLRQKRAFRVRKTLKGTAERPRLSVNKSNKHIIAQLIDDEKGVVLGMSGTVAKEFRGTPFEKKSKESAKKIGESIATIAKKNNIHEVIFDRGSAKYHGILAELANAARAGGLKF